MAEVVLGDSIFEVGDNLSYNKVKSWGPTIRLSGGRDEVKSWDIIVILGLQCKMPKRG